MANLTVFNFESQEVRFVGTSDDPWWVAADICMVLEHSDTSKAVSRLDSDEKGTKIVRTPGGNQQMLCINESGLYSLVLTSRKPQAKRFKKWLTSEVLPTIRKTGAYSIVEKPAPAPLQLPPPHIQVTNLANALEKFGIDFDNPRYSQQLKDLTLNILGVNSPAPLGLNASSEVWTGVTERAEELGYPVLKVAAKRSQLGKYIKAQELEARQEKRLVNGTQRPVNIYEVTPELDRAIQQFFFLRDPLRYLQENPLASTKMSLSTLGLKAKGVFL